MVEILKVKKSINFLKNLRSNNSNKKIGLCHGVFDILHYGHVEHLKNAKKKCDILVVSITTDKFVNKGPDQPYNNTLKRAKFLEEINSIDYVYINDDLTPIKIIKSLKPNLYFKGSDYKNVDVTGNLELEIKEIKKNKGKIIFTKTPMMSSTKIYNNFFNDFSKDQKNYLKQLSKKINYNRIIKIFENLKNQEINIIGEIILDNYIFCEISGLTSKDPALSIIENNKKNLPGGCLAVAMMASKFCKTVNLFTYGNSKKIKSFLKKYKNINIRSIDNKTPIQVKTRYLNQNRYEKLIQVTNYKNINFNKNINRVNKVKSFFKSKDKMIICDYGIGLFDDKITKFINKSKVKKFINVQSNSINFGFNLVSKYKKAKYVSLDEKEWKLELNLNENYNLQKFKLLKKYDFISLTLGKRGSIFFDKEKKDIFAPALIKKTLDTTGCGDAYFLMSSILLNETKDYELCIFLSNLYAGLHGQIIGNETFVDKVKFLKSIKSFLNI